MVGKGFFLTQWIITETMKKRRKQPAGLPIAFCLLLAEETSMRKPRLALIIFAVLVLTSSAAAQSPYPTKQWLTATPQAVGLEAKTLADFDADIASGKFGNVDSFLVIRHGKLVYDRSYKHD